MKTKLLPSQELSPLVNFMLMKVDEKETNEYLERKAKQTITSDINLSDLLEHEPLVFKKNILRDLEIEKTTKDVIPITIGRAFENFFLPFLLETGRFEREVETFFKVKGSMGEWTISGRADLVEYLNVSNPKMTDKDIIIRDWKSTSAYQMEQVLKEFNRYEKSGVLPKHKYFWQLQAYKYAFTQNGYNVHDLSLMIYCRHWTQKKSTEINNFPSSEFFERRVPEMPMEQIEEYLKERASAHQELNYGQSFPEATEPQCSEEERWVRNGVSMRCNLYCDVGKSGLCPQFNKEKAGYTNTNTTHKRSKNAKQ